VDFAGCPVNAQQVIAADKRSRLPGADDAGDAVFASHDRGMAQTAAEVCDDAGYLVNMGKPFWTVHRGDGDTVSGQVPIVGGLARQKGFAGRNPCRNARAAEQDVVGRFCFAGAIGSAVSTGFEHPAHSLAFSVHAGARHGKFDIHRADGRSECDNAIADG